MVRLNTLLATLLVAILGIAIPTAFVYWLAQQQSAEAEKERATAYARDVLEKSESTLQGFTDLVTRLSPMMVGHPCAPENLNLMEYASLSSSDIKALGYVENNELLCSSLNIPGRTFYMGAADFVMQLSPPLEIRTDVHIPRIDELEFVVFEQSGISGLIQEQTPLDAVTESRDIRLAVYGVGREKPLFENRPVGTQWQSYLPQRGETSSFIGDQYVVAIARSATLDIVAVAMLPMTYLEEYSRELLGYLLPPGLIAGAVLIWAVIFLSRHQMAMPQAIRSGLRHREFYLVYQPIIDLATGRWAGAEALMRWRRPNGEIVNPEVFMAAAESSGLMASMTERLLELVEHDARKLLATSDEFHIALNFSADDIHDPRMVARLKTLQQASGAGPSQLILEVTERALTSPDQAIEVIQKLREEGIPVAVDDFGTGYSSLSYLESFDFDYLKIDRFFVKSITTDGTAANNTVLQHIIEMAKSLKLGMIAEGVETEAQGSTLREYGVQYAQGWLFSKPLNAARLLAQIAEHNADVPKTA